MKKRYFLRLVSFTFLLAGSNLSAQYVLTEYSKTHPENKIRHKRIFDEHQYTKIRDKNDHRVFVQNRKVNQTKANDVTLSVSLTYDPDQYQADRIMVIVYNESGYQNFGFWEGSDVISIDVPEGTYDILTQFVENSGKMHYVVKEQQSITADTTVNVDVSEAANYVSLNIYDENGNVLQPGIENPETGDSSEINTDCLIYFEPKGSGIVGSGYQISVPVSGIWNFYINNVSNRYSILQTIVATGYESNKNYFSKFETLNSVTESVTVENNPADWVFHAEKFQPSSLGASSGEVYPALSTLQTYKGEGLGGMTLFTYGTPLNTEEGFKMYLNNPFDDNPADFLVSPAMTDYLGTVTTDWGETLVLGTLIMGNAIVKSGSGVLYESGSSINFDNYFLGTLGNGYYFGENNWLGIFPFHPRFSFSSSENTDIKQGNNVPISVVGISDKIKSNYLGRYGEIRESDFFATTAEVKQNGSVVFSGEYVADGFQNYEFPNSGNFEVTFINTNTEVDGFAGKNTTKLFFDKSKEDSVPPTLQHLQFRNTSGKVTDRFASASEGTVRIAAGDFKYTPTDQSWGGYFAYNPGNVVKFYYSQHDQNNWAELPLISYPEYFQMPAFGDYYEASLAGIENTEPNTWYDVRIICTDAAGNRQEQIVSPAFKINETMAVTDINKTGISIYPNPVKDMLNFSEEVSNIKITDMSGRMVKELSVSGKSVNVSNLAKGSYIMTATAKSGEKISRKFIKE